MVIEFYLNQHFTSLLKEFLFSLKDERDMVADQDTKIRDGSGMKDLERYCGQLIRTTTLLLSPLNKQPVTDNDTPHTSTLSANLFIVFVYV